MKQPTKTKYWFLLVTFLLLGAAVRIGGMAFTNDWLHYDEGYYGIDAESLIEHPRLVPYFSGNQGREALWMYILTIPIILFGNTVFALRLAGLLAGIVTLAALFRLARALFGISVAVWSVGVLSVLYWHIHLSHNAYRALLAPIFAALALAILLEAYRQQRLKKWGFGGFLLGVMVYTYTPSQSWTLLVLGLLALVVLFDSARRQGAMLAIVICALVAAPLLLYRASSPYDENYRVALLAVRTPGQLLKNILIWLNAWLYRGADYGLHNIPYRPILDVPLALLLGAGLFGMSWRKYRELILVVLLLGAGIAPSLITLEAPQYLRAICAVLPIALLLGYGAYFLDIMLPRYIQWFPLLLIGWAAVHNGGDYWVYARDFYYVADYQKTNDHIQRVIANMQAVQRSLPIPVYLRGDAPQEATFRYFAWGTPQLEVFEFPNCFIAPQTPFAYIGTLSPDQGITARWFNVLPLFEDPDTGLPEYRYGLYQAETPFHEIIGEVGDVQVAWAQPTTLQAQRGGNLALDLRFTALDTLTRPYTVFVHLYPLDEVRLLTQTDVGLCSENYPTTRWQDGQTARMGFNLPIPKDLPIGSYRLVLGLYDSETFERLPSWNGETILPLGKLQVRD